MIIESLAHDLEPVGLIVRGAFHPTDEDGVPGNPGTLVLIGNAGPNMWNAFGPNMPSGADPLDHWSKTQIERSAHGFGGRAVYPFEGPPYHPFQTWAQKADNVSPSPIGPLIHPTFGLWHAYRGAVLFDAKLSIPEIERTPSPCESCEDKPCLSACPVDAFAGDSYDVPKCRTHIATSEGAACMNLGCEARRACPVGREYIYQPDQALFHMEKFLRPD